MLFYYQKIEMRISIITVSYNSGNTLSNTIESVLSQGFSDIEYIIVDGCSKDGTTAIIKSAESSFNGRLKWVSEPDKGLYDAMNKGIKMATGDVIGILNSDDLFYDSNVLRDIALAFDENTDALFGNLYFVKSDDVHCIVRAWKGSTYSSFKKGWHPAHPTFTFVGKFMKNMEGLIYRLMCRQILNLCCVLLRKIVSEQNIWIDIW